jgi:hypothetical protein
MTGRTAPVAVTAGWAVLAASLPLLDLSPEPVRSALPFLPFLSCSSPSHKHLLLSVHGSYNWPTDYGGAGGNGARGGGVIHIKVLNELILNGKISANGASAVFVPNPILCMSPTFLPLVLSDDSILLFFLCCLVALVPYGGAAGGSIIVEVATGGVQGTGALSVTGGDGINRMRFAFLSLLL